MAWLERKSVQKGVPVTELVRTAVRRMREEDEASFERLLRQTSGSWIKGDGLTYQRNRRREWE